jgi:hypothetical protein
VETAVADTLENISARDREAARRVLELLARRLDPRTSRRRVQSSHRRTSRERKKEV